MEGVLQSVEAACNDLQVPERRAAAEATLLELRKSPHALQACTHILDNSRNPVACFQAAATLQQVVLRDWPRIPTADHTSLHRYCVDHIVGRAAAREEAQGQAGGGDAFVEHKMVGVLAVLVKRAWLDVDDNYKSDLFSSLRDLASGSRGPAVQRAAFSLLDALVSEFNPGSATPLAMPSDFHNRCRIDFQRHFLMPVLMVCVDAVAAHMAAVKSQAEAAQAQGQGQGQAQAQGAVVVWAGSSQAVVAAALSVLIAVLSWDFTGGSARASKSKGSDDGSQPTARSSSDMHTVQPPNEWLPLLLSAELLSLLASVYSSLPHTCAPGLDWREGPLAERSRQVAVLLCSLHGPALTAADQSLVRMHVGRLLALLLQWLSPLPATVAAVAQARISDRELLDVCRALAALIRLHPLLATTPASTQHASANSSANGPSPPPTLLSLLGELTCCVLAHGAASDDDSLDGPMPHALDLLLDTWLGVLLTLESRISCHVISRPASTSPQQAAAAAEWSHLMHAVSPVAAQAFRSFTQHHLQVAAASALEEEDAADNMDAALQAQEQRMAAAASLARASLQASLPLLNDLLTHQKALLLQAADAAAAAAAAGGGGAGGGEVERVMEQVQWTVRMVGYVLADEGTGETPELPVFLVHELNSHHAHSLTALTTSLPMSILEVASLVLNPSAVATVLSPRLMESFLWFFSRWSLTYLLPQPPDANPPPFDPDTDPPPLSASLPPGDTSLASAAAGGAFVQAFGAGEGQGGLAVLEGVLRAGVAALSAWLGEPDVQSSVCRTLLLAVTRRPYMAAYLRHLPPWAMLEEAFKTRDSAVASLPGPLQRSLAHVLCRAASSSKEGHSCHQVVQQLLQPLLASLHGITSRPDFPATAHRPQVMFQVVGLLECMRGCASATLPHSQRVLFQFGLSAATPILTALSAYRHEPQVVFVILKFMAVWVDSQILFLNADDTAQLFHFCLQLLQAYAAHNMGKVSLQRSRQLREGVRESKYKDLKALLQLLSSLTSKDLLDFGASLPGQSADVAQMVCLGVNIIIPLISLDLLQFPKLCLQYFTLLEHMCCVHPDKVLALPDSAFHPIMHTLEFALQHQDEDILVLALSAVSSLASPPTTTSSSSASSASPHAPMAPEHAQRHQALVAHLLRLVLRLVLLQPLRNETVEAAADALLPLILSCPQLTQTILSEAVSSHVDPACQHHLSAAVTAFLSAASAAAAASASASSAAAARPVRRRFRSALAAFIADVQGLIVRR
ncbi:hypothetical protein CLOM_g22612 [Closterium sp. NIES-68]|nr:hypothetical protein CLOM_g22612 [Closterium sp. NIES-68]GJP76193.1 hypothetical protein CLOP_g6562 [Closterium sp. NIES-67]